MTPPSDPPRNTEPSPVDELPEPARSLARQVLDELEARGHDRALMAEQAAKQAANYVAERSWDARELPEELLEAIEANS